MITGLCLILPRTPAAPWRTVLAALDPQLAVQLYKHDPGLNILEKIDPRRAGNLDTWLVPHRESEALLNLAQPALNAILALAPQAVTLHPAAQSAKCGCAFAASLRAPG